MSPSLCVSAHVCITGLGALHACAKKGAGGQEWVHMCVPVCAWRAVGNAAEENHVIV